MINHILLAFDGSDSSSKAFDGAADLAQRYQAELHVFTVAEAPQIGDQVRSRPKPLLSIRATTIKLHGLKHRGDRYGVKLHVQMVGSPGAADSRACRLFQG